MKEPTNFFYYYKIANLCGEDNLREKEILENYALDLGICKKQLDNSIHNTYDLDESLTSNLKFLYELYISVSKRYEIDEELNEILKKYCAKVGFFDSNIQELSEILIVNAKKNTLFKDLLNSLRV
ncbi:hypothetical protein QLS71_002740 [Mariniflexile litorale]|uniref:Uncharacterized protein n=1 Tax=Mariniflexile litorale TaxID=3045158 RepID=A0AAU7EHC7_9FLAO|nr:hypothetical protein [Mariniflexile sp. KMM 9835]MDQ8209936.1 hypothetical protein [Mariniflexile sp. KMM 9835]